MAGTSRGFAHEHDRSDFSDLRAAIIYHPNRLLFCAFDLLAINGRDLRALPLADRRECLADLIGDHDPTGLLQYSAHIVGDGTAMFKAADAMGLEGIVSKKPARDWGQRAPFWRVVLSFDLRIDNNGNASPKASRA